MNLRGDSIRLLDLFIYTSSYGCEPSFAKTTGVILGRSAAIELFPRCARGKLYHPRFIPERPLGGISVVRTLIHGYAMQNEIQISWSSGLSFFEHFSIFSIGYISRKCRTPLF